jgi:hypothetical protein
MEEVPFEIFLNIGEQLCNETDIEEKYNLTFIKNTKTYEEYKNNYKEKLELRIADNKKIIHELDKEIADLERKITEIVRMYCNKRISNNSLNLVYMNKPIIKYLNSLENEKMKFYELTLQNLKGQYDSHIEILKKNYVLWNKINNK